MIVKSEISSLIFQCSCKDLFGTNIRRNAHVLHRLVEQPFKIPFVAAIIVVINPRKPEVTKEVLTLSTKAIQGYLENGAWREVKLVLRFLGCLQGILDGDGVFPILEELFSRAVDLQTASSEDVSKAPSCQNQG